MSRATTHDVSESQESEATNSAGLKDLSTKQPEKKALQIKGSDLNLVMDSTKLSRQEVLDLFQKTNGDVKATLELYVTQ